MKIIASYSIKGGVGKTAAAVNLAYQASNDGLRTLLVDLDPQGASGFYYKVKAKRKYKSVDLINKKKSIRDHIRESDFENLDILPSKMNFRHIDLELGEKKNSENNLRKSLKELNKDYDLLVLDCPPNITLLSENIFNAADIILIPIIPSPLSERTFEQILGFFGKHNYHFKKIKAFFSLAEKRKIVHRETMERLKEKYNFILDTIIPKSADVEKMGIYRKPVQCFAINRVGGRAYRDLTREILSEI